MQQQYDEYPEAHFCESPACTVTPSCVGWSAGYADPDADREAYLHSLACCPAGHYGCECDGTDCPFEQPMVAWPDLEQLVHAVFEERLDAAIQLLAAKEGK